MARLFVANCTAHNQIVSYRVDFVPEGQTVSVARRAPRFQPIPSGRQVALGGDLDVGQIKEIVEQLNVFGMVGVVDLRGKLPGFIPYLFDIDKAIPKALIKRVVDHNKGVQILEGQARRRKAALAANDALISKLAEVNVDVADGAEPFTVGYEQLDVSELDEKPIGEGYKVEPAAAAQKGRGKRSGARPAA